MKKIKSLALALALSAAAFAGTIMPAAPASATLIGDNIDIWITFDHSDSTFPTPDGYTALDVHLVDVLVQDAISPPEAQVDYFGNRSHAFGVLSVDVDDSAFALGLFGGTGNPGVEPAFIPPFQLWLEGLEWVGMPGTITDVVADPTNFPGFTVSDFGTDAATGVSFIHIDFPGINSGPAGLPFFFGVAIFNIEAEHGQVPEPATLAIFGFGLAGLDLMRRRKRAAVS